MKKVWIIIIAVVALLAVSITCAVIYSVNTPEYALKQIKEDVKEYGIDGLKPHLTANAQETIDTVTSITDNELFNAIMGLINKSDFISILKSEIQEIQWDVEEVLKSKDKAQVTLSFNYEDKLIGTIELSMIREDDGWKIDGFEFPEFDEINW